jgi:hypothetical protein
MIRRQIIPTKKQKQKKFNHVLSYAKRFLPKMRSWNANRCLINFKKQRA